MYLVENMIKRGITIDEVLELAKKKVLRIDKEEILNEFKREENQVELDDKKLKSFFIILKNTGKALGQTKKIQSEYNANGKSFKNAYLHSLYISDDIDENDYSFVFLSNRYKRVTGRDFGEYNEYFLQEKSRDVNKKLLKYKIREKENTIISPEFLEIFQKGRSTDINKSYKSKKNLETESEGIDIKDKDIAYVVQNMEQNAKKYKAGIRNYDDEIEL